MSRTSFLQDLLSTIFERGTPRLRGEDPRSLKDLCAALMSERGEATGTRIAAAILDHFEAATPGEKRTFFHMLRNDHDIDCDGIIDAAQRYRDGRDAGSLSDLLREAEPPRQELLRRLNQLTGGTGRLVKLREDLLRLVADEPDLRTVDLDFQHLFTSWFNRGFLVLRRIDWTTPANILEKIIAYEAVHAINDWDDLRRRLQPPDRRCFAFFHPAMPDEPLIFVEVALTTEIPGSIQELLSERTTPLEENAATTAVFYSISNCQKGLTGVSFGNFLIKQVATDLSQTLPNLKTFVTLSPVPGFVRWLSGLDDDGLDDAERRRIDGLFDASTPEELAPYANAAAALAAEYLVRAKRPDGQPLDPVARFHLGNGAILERVHALADISSQGIAQSRGVMVNYRYDLKSVEANHEAYAHQREVMTTRAVRSLLKAERNDRNARRTEHA